MPKTKLKDLTATQITRISGIREALKEVEFGQASYDLVVGTDQFKLLLAERISAHFGNTGLSFLVGNSTLAIQNVGKTMFFNVGGTNVVGHDGVNMFIVLAGTTYKFATAAGTTFGIN